MSQKKESPLDIELHQACKRGDARRVQQILDTGRVHVDCQDEEDGTTPLMLAIAGHYPACVATLLREGAEPNLAKKNGIGPLMLASQLGFTEVARNLIQHGTNVDATNQDGGTALMFACQWGRDDIVQILMDAGCNIHKAMLDGTTALFLAAQNGHSSAVVRLILECEKRNRNLGIFVAAPRRDGASPLFIAAQSGHTECVRELLARGGAEVDQSRIDDATPLFKACHKGHLEVVAELLKYNANVGILQNGETCLHAAALSGNPHMVKTLLVHLGDAAATDIANLRNRENKTALDLAKESGGGNEDIVKLLTPFIRKPVLVTSSALSKSSLSSNNSSSGDSPRQRVRFAMDVAAECWRRSLQVETPQRVQCKMLHSDEMRSERRSPVRVVWRSNPGQVQARQQVDERRSESPEQHLCFGGRTH